MSDVRSEVTRHRALSPSYSTVSNAELDALEAEVERLRAGTEERDAYITKLRELLQKVPGTAVAELEAEVERLREAMKHAQDALEADKPGEAWTCLKAEVSRASDITAPRAVPCPRCGEPVGARCLPMDEHEMAQDPWPTHQERIDITALPSKP